MSGLRRAMSGIFVFGHAGAVKAHSRVEAKLAACLPPTDWPVFDENGDLKAFNGWHVFGSETARNHFIKHALILLSSNGRHDLCGLSFDNFFARSYDKTGVIWHTASIVATAPGDYRIRHSVVASRAGTTKTAAFQLLMLEVEAKLDAMLKQREASQGDLPNKRPKHKPTVVSIISTPYEAMPPPKVEADDDDACVPGPLMRSPESKSSAQFTRSPKSSADCAQHDSASSRDPRSSGSSQSTLGSKQPESFLFSVPERSATVCNQKSHSVSSRRQRHASTPVLPPSTAGKSPPPKTAKHVSQPPRAISVPVEAQSEPKKLPPLPRSSLERPRVQSPEPKSVHSALRDAGDRAGAASLTRGLSKSTIASRCAIGCIAEENHDVRPLAVELDGPSPLHAEKPSPQIPLRMLAYQAAFEIYV